MPYMLTVLGARKTICTFAVKSRKQLLLKVCDFVQCLLASTHFDKWCVATFIFNEHGSKIMRLFLLHAHILYGQSSKNVQPGNDDKVRHTFLN